MLKLKPITITAVALVIVIQSVLSGAAFASGLPQSELNALYTYPNYVQNYATCVTSTNPSGGSSAPPSQNQNQIASTIIGIAKTLNLGQQGAIIGIMVALDESGLTIYSNSNIPISLSNPAATAVGHDYNSVGVFQQQPDTGWSTFATGQAALSNQQAVYQDMDPAFSAEAFFGIPPGSTLPPGLANPSALTKGLENHAGWQSMQPWVAGSLVQGNAAGATVYQKFYAQAQSMVSQLYANSAAVPLPIPITGGSPSPGSSAVGTTGCFPGSTGSTGDTNSNTATKAVIQAGLAEIAKNIPYSYGGGGPNGPSAGQGGVVGFDCSSFMQYVLWQGAQIHISRTTNSQYAETVGAGHSVQLAAIQPGDLIFYGTATNNISHVAMYVGNNMVIQAPSTGHNLDEITMYQDAGNGEVIQGIGFYPPIGG